MPSPSDTPDSIPPASDKVFLPAAGGNSSLTQMPVIPPYCWDPPETLPLKAWPGVLADGATKHGPYPDKNMPDCKLINATAFEDFPGQEHSKPNEPKLKKNPHPLSDFTHVDPSPAETPADKRPQFHLLRSKFDPTKPDEKRRIAELDYLETMNRAAGPDADGFQRLKRCFDILVCRAHKLLVDINEAVKGKGDYSLARKAYREFVANVDDREPHFKEGGVDIVKRYGYGKNIQWVFIDPVIKRVDAANAVLITDARIIIKWNPHSSSSGVPIPH